MPNTNPGASSDLYHPALLLTALEMDRPLSSVLSVHLGLALTFQPKPGTLGCCSSSLCWLMEAAPQTKSWPMGPARVCQAQHSPMSPAAEEKAPGLCEPCKQGSNENTGVETGGFLFLAREKPPLLQVSVSAARTVWLLRCSGRQHMTRL